MKEEILFFSDQHQFHLESLKKLAVPLSTFWSATQLLPRAEVATIPPMKEEMQCFHMTQNFSNIY